MTRQQASGRSHSGVVRISGGELVVCAAHFIRSVASDATPRSSGGVADPPSARESYENGNGLRLRWRATKSPLVRDELHREQLLSVADYARVARAKLTKGALDYYEGGALDEITLRENTAGWERLKLYYRVLAGVRERELQTTVLGQGISMPIVVAPTAFHRLACEAGEIATSRAAKAAGTLFILSSLSNTPMEKVFAQAASPRWFQLYVYKDREITRELVQRAEAAGAEAIVLTVDAPGLGTRERDSRNRFTLPDGLAVENLSPLVKGDLPQVTGSGLAAYVRDNFKSDLGIEDLDWLCSCSTLPVVVKGLVRGDDARRAAEHGARAVVV